MSDAQAPASRRPHAVRRLYDWVLHWADTPYGAWALFLNAFAESSFFPIPPDVLLIALAAGKPKKSFRYAFICTAGSTLGGVLGYAIGYFLWMALGRPTDPVSLAAVPPISGGALLFKSVPGFSPVVFLKVRNAYEAHALLTVFTAAFTPIPYKVITIAAGVCKVSLLWFMVGSVVGRTMRFFLVSGLIYRFGKPVKAFIDRYFNLLTIAFTVLLVAGFLALRYWHAIAGLFRSLF